MLFGRSRRQAPTVSKVTDTAADASVLTDLTEPPSSSWEAVKEAAFEPQQAQQAQHDEGAPSQGSAWQTKYAGISSFASPVPADESPGSAAFATPSSALLTDAMTNPPPLQEAADEAEVDPLSHRFEQRMLSEPAHVNLQDTSDESQPPPAQQPQPWGGDRGWGRGGVSTPMRSRAASPSLSDHGSFDPLTATFEEFEAFNRSREKHQSQLPEQMLDQSSTLSNQQLPQQLPQQQQQPATAAATSGQQPRKTRSIPRIFRLRKTGSTADASSTSTEAAAAASSIKPVEAEDSPVLLSTDRVDPNQAGGSPQETPPGSNVAQAAAVPRPRSKPFGLLRKRSKGTAQTLTSQQSLLTVPVPSEAVPMCAPLPEAGEGGQDGLLGDPPTTDKGAEEQQHVNTVLGLSAGLTNTFGSFMAASAAASPRASSSSPHEVLECAKASKQTSSDQVSTLVAVAACCRCCCCSCCCSCCCCGGIVVVGCFVHTEDCPAYSRHVTDLAAQREGKP